MAMKSENWAGVVSLTGSSLLVLNGGVSDFAAAAQFTVAELSLSRYGHKSWGYSGAAATFATGDLTLAFANSVPSGSFLQYSLFAMAGAWGIGALKYPFEKAASHFNNAALKKVADSMPTICGTGNLLLRVPGVTTALQSQNWVLAGAVAAWGVGDVLAGRLQEKVVSIYNYAKQLKPNNP